MKKNLIGLIIAASFFFLLSACGMLNAFRLPGNSIEWTGGQLGFSSEVEPETSLTFSVEVEDSRIADITAHETYISFFYIISSKEYTDDNFSGQLVKLFNNQFNENPYSPSIAASNSAVKYIPNSSNESYYYGLFPFAPYNKSTKGTIDLEPTLIPSSQIKNDFSMELKNKGDAIDKEYVVELKRVGGDGKTIELARYNDLGLFLPGLTETDPESSSDSITVESAQERLYLYVFCAVTILPQATSDFSNVLWSELKPIVKFILRNPQ